MNTFFQDSLCEYKVLSQNIKRNKKIMRKKGAGQKCSFIVTKIFNKLPMNIKFL